MSSVAPSAAAPSQTPPLGALTPAPAAVAAPEPARLLLWLLAAALLPRLGLFFFNENLYGDAVVRTELAERWLGHPHWIRGYGDGTFQFGPLHVYLGALFLKLLPYREHAGRLMSLVFGTLSVVPLYALTRRLFGWKAAAWACLALAAWGMHLQMSTTAASEALALFLMLGVFALYAEALDENRFAPLFWSAVLLNFACATRYDAWMYMPLLTGLLLFSPGDVVARVTRAVGFGLVCLPFPLVWMQGNELMHGDPFFPIHDIEKFHAAWVADGVGRYGHLLYRLQNLGFWPAMALFTLTPGVALLGALGMRRAWKTERETRWLILSALLPAAFYAFKGAVLLNFVPLGRFTVTQLVVLLPFVWLGYETSVAGRSAGARRAVGVATVLLAVAMPLALGLYTFRRDGGLADTMRPVSPVTTNPVPIMEAARYLKAEAAAKGKGAILDDEPQLYMDLQLAFFSGLPELRMARYRWDTFRQRLADADPAVLVRFDNGNLAKDPGVKLEGRTLSVDGLRFEEVDGFHAPVHVYHRAP
ncbi:glycosyltransferase family 39 protein [Aggregicoccus sp. 17bor-14]|uniref:ArnT family glycosyltransferase n=1 Tax=Myxococcaceae TaxID=31 RepID=UPI00129D171B|nr:MULTISPECIES: glycosyltransferase family 39 protein [Myxococcaceae]MBF5044698.1 glycosyltransferase family 39 protein [Simulacricoccus sp. 17bor-14]MRI90442.1 glycosyltransferase family 39 protein [Aggregicoccus sp. 17bor-14]